MRANPTFDIYYDVLVKGWKIKEMERRGQSREQ